MAMSLKPKLNRLSGSIHHTPTVKSSLGSKQCQSHAGSFFAHEGIVRHEHALVGKTIYKRILRRLREAVRCKRPTLHRLGDRQLHHDDAPTQVSQLVQRFLAKRQITRSSSLCYHQT